MRISFGTIRNVKPLFCGSLKTPLAAILFKAHTVCLKYVYKSAIAGLTWVNGAARA